MARCYITACFENPRVPRLQLTLTVSVNHGTRNAALEMTAKDRLDRVRSLLEARASSEQTQFPLSRGQQAIWLTYLHSPNSPAYNISFSARVISGLDVPALERALQTLVDRHPSLRSTFYLNQDQPVQIVHERQSFRLDHQDLSHLDHKAFKHAVQKAYEAPFNLETGPVFRAHLLRDADGIVLLLVVHHVAADAWSLLLMLNELEFLYPRETTGAGVVPDPPAQVFADHVMLEKEYLSEDMAEKDWEYWKSSLAGSLSTLDLPLDRQRPVVRTENGASHYFKIDRAATAALRELAKAEGATLYMVLLAAFKVQLSRYSGQESIIVGSSTAGRVRSEFRDVIGYFVNPVALQSDLSGDPSFSSFLGSVKHTVIQAITHSRLPFPVVLDKLSLRRDPSRTPVFQVMFSMLKPSRDDGIEELMMPGNEGYRLNWAGLALEYYEVAQQEGQFDLTLNLVEGKEEVFGTIKYNTDLYDRDRIQRMAGHYCALLGGIAADPGCPVTKVPLMSESEASYVLNEWNQTDVEIPDGCIHQLFEAHAEKNPEQLAVVLADEAISYGELNRRANRLANRLLAKGLEPEDSVGIFMNRSTELIAAILAVLKAGGAYVPLDPIQPPERLVAMMEQAEARFLLMAGKVLPGLESKNVEVIDLETKPKTCEPQENQNPGVELGPTSTAYVLFTSGSTGKPKGVAVEHGNVINHVCGILQNLALEPGFSFASLTSVGADLGNTAIFTSLCGGGTLYLAPPYRAGDVESVLQFLSEKTIDCYKITPSFLSALMAGGKDPGSLLPQRHLLIGGEAMNWSLLESLWALSPRCSIHNHYGPTETTIGVSMNLMAPVSPEQRPANPPIGRPLANCRLYVLDKHLQPLPVGVPGELFIGGRSVARGYLNLPEETLSRFMRDPFDPRAESKMYRSGDRVQRLSDGKVRFLDRVDDQVKIRGYRVEPGEVRRVVAGFAGVQDAVVMARKDSNAEERLVAYLVPEADRHLNIQQVRAYLKQKLPEYMIPTAFVELEKLPLNQLGKLDRKGLPAPDRSSYIVEAEHVPPKTTTERDLASIWSEVLSIPKISVHDSFFNIGGDSLSAIRILARMRDHFGVSISVVDLFEAPTIAGAATIIDNCMGVIEFMKTGPAEQDQEWEEIEL
jgi:amino acid adenylation domain-containing protein